MREGVQQHQEAPYPDASPSKSGHYSGNRGLESVVGPWDDRPVRARDISADEDFSSIHIIL